MFSYWFFDLQINKKHTKYYILMRIKIIDTNLISIKKKPYLKRQTKKKIISNFLKNIMVFVFVETNFWFEENTLNVARCSLAYQWSQLHCWNNAVARLHEVIIILVHRLLWFIHEVNDSLFLFFSSDFNSQRIEE